MAFERWFGGVGTFSDPEEWQPSVVPQSGDTAVITLGTLSDYSAGTLAKPSDHLSVFAIAQTGETPPTISPTYWNFSQSTIIMENRANTAVMPFTGGKYFANAGSMEFVGGRFLLAQVGPFFTLGNSGTMSFIDADVAFSSVTPFYDLSNQGYLTFGGNEANEFAVTVSGTGVIVIEPNADVTFAKDILSGQTIQFAGTASSAAVVTIRQPYTFRASIANFSQGERIALAGLDGSYSATYASTDASSGVLTLTSPSQPTVTLKFIGSYQTSDFNLNPDGQGLSIGTVRADTRAPDPIGHDGRQVYRFFDLVNGTHFYTSSISERDDIPATRSDLAYEGAVFRDVDQMSDATAAPVYRFFDTTLGTHFFTTSTGERDQLISTRRDLAYEGVGFYEHASAQPGDTPVTRFFNTGDGSHLYVSSSTEAATIQLTRPDLRYEGVAFYTPSV